MKTKLCGWLFAIAESLLPKGMSFGEAIRDVDLMSDEDLISELIERKRFVVLTYGEKRTVSMDQLGLEPVVIFNISHDDIPSVMTNMQRVIQEAFNRGIESGSTK